MIYERIMSGEKLRVRLPGSKKPFSVQRLLLMGESHYVTEQSEWVRFGNVGGVVINGRIREKMHQVDMRDWCGMLREVEL